LLLCCSDLQADLHVTDNSGRRLLELAWAVGALGLLKDLIQLGVVFQEGCTLPSWHEVLPQGLNPQVSPPCSSKPAWQAPGTT
jgi:hypothetical protein